MVNTDIPENYTASPSSLAGTPQLTINHEATLDLDSSNSFEGPEKLLEVWFAPSSSALPATARPNGLKAVSRTKWTEMLDLVHCKVLSVIESEQVDAYLLSESSMFVFPHKLVLKTCGITTLLYGIGSMLEIAALCAGFPHIPANPEMGKLAMATPYRVFYSRKNYLYPEQQHGPHRSWRDEVKALDRLFSRGSAYMIGKMNGEHWYLYITEPETEFTPPSTPEHERLEEAETPSTTLQLPDVSVAGVPVDDQEDETLEILMTDLDEENAKQFYVDHANLIADPVVLENVRRQGNSDDRPLLTIPEGGVVFEMFDQENSGSAKPDVEMSSEGHLLGSVVSSNCGLADLYPPSKFPEARIDAYLFSPCGFSANGVIPAPVEDTNDAGGKAASCHYFTVHVTPEPQCSYASFETNVPARQTGRETAEVLEQVVNIFRPGRFSVTLFESKGDSYGRTAATLRPQKRSPTMDAIKGYRRVDRIVHDLDGYDLVFRYFERHDWKGGMPRLGEEIY